MSRSAVRVAQRQFKFYQLALVSILILIFIVVAVDRIWRLRAEAERLAVFYTLAAIQSSLAGQLAQLAAQRHVDGLNRLHRSNPIELVQPPRNYHGILESLTIPPDQSGWYFVEDEGVLAYRAQFDKFLTTSYPFAPIIRFRLEFDLSQAKVSMPGLRPLDSYQWQSAFD
jgi:hypothetical protein